MTGQLAPDLTTARNALLSGDRATARNLVMQIIRQQPNNAQAWLLLSGMVDTPAQQQDCLRLVLKFDPTNEAARRGMAVLEGFTPGSKIPEPPPRSRDSFDPGPISTAGATTPLPPREPPEIAMVEPPAAPAPSYRRSSVRPRTRQSTPAAEQTNGRGPAAEATESEPAPQRPRRRSRARVEPIWYVAIGLLCLLVVAATFYLRRGGGVRTPSVSAQSRSTDFINGLFSFTTRPEFYDHTQRDSVLAPLLRDYGTPGKRMSGLINVSNGLMEGMSSAERTLFMESIERMYVVDADYSVEQESPTAIVLRVQRGSIWYVFRNGRSSSVPLQRAIDKVYLTNIDGVWYIDDISAPSV